MADLASPRWWFSVVIAGILVNMAASYLLRFIDAKLIEVSSWWRRKRVPASGEALVMLHQLQTDPQKQATMQSVEVRHRLHSLVFLIQAVGMALLSVLLMTVGSPAWIAFPAIALFAVLWYLFVRQSRLADRASSFLTRAHQK